MSIKQIVQLQRQEYEIKNTSLRQACKPVVSFDMALQQIIADLIDTMFAHTITIGLAAPQIGVDACVAIVGPARDKEKLLVLVNPKITKLSGKKDKKRESCMSLPNYGGEVERRSRLTVWYQDQHGKRHSLDAEGFMARVIQHEVDHLGGILYVDRLEDLSKLEPVDIFKNDIS